MPIIEIYASIADKSNDEKRMIYILLKAILMVVQGNPIEVTVNLG